MRNTQPRVGTRVGIAVALGAVTLGWLPTVGAAESKLTIFDGLAASQSIYIQPRANSIFALPADQLIGATQAEINSQPRAQGYAATWGVPLAQNLRGVGIPIDYAGQCYANYPGEASVDCGVPAKELTVPKAPEGGPGGGGAFGAHAEASGNDTDPEQTRAFGVTEAGGLFAEGAFRIRYNHSTSEAKIEGGAVHSVTRSVAQGIEVGGALKIGSVEAFAEAVHPGDTKAATGVARTEMQNVTIGGVPVTIGPEGITVQGQPLGQAPDAVTKPILDSMAAEGMTIEPLPAPTVNHDGATGLVEARSSGFRVQLLSPNGDGKFEMIFGRALARAGAVRAEDDLPFEVPVGQDPVPLSDGESSTAGATPLPGASSPAGTGAGSLFPSPANLLAAGLAEATADGDPVAGDALDLSAVPATATAAAPAAASVQLAAAGPRDLDPLADVSGRVLVAYAAIVGVIAASAAFGLHSRGRRFATNSQLKP